MRKQRDHYRVTASMRRRITTAHQKAQARKHKHVCQWCPADDVYVCTKFPCQHLKKKPCPQHKWIAKRGRAPDDERMDFMPPTVSLAIEVTTKVKWGADGGPIIGIDLAAVEQKVVQAVIGEYADWPSNTHNIVEDENGFVSLELKKSAEEMGKKMAKTLDDLIEDEDGASYPEQYQGKGFTPETVKKMMEAGQDATTYASYKDFL